MITVYEVLSEYCKTYNLPPPSQNDLSGAGALISTHFRRFWGIMQSPEIIEKACFTWSKEPGRTILVIGYPEVFKGEMIARIELFFKQKHDRISKGQQNKAIIEKPKIKPEPASRPISYSSDPQKKERKRKPIQPAPRIEYSGKNLSK
jgi:hypothetical protein